MKIHDRVFGSTLALAVISGSAASRADVLSWSNAAGGAASTASNWNPQQVPDGNDDLFFNVNSGFTVTWNAAVRASRSQTFQRGIVSLSYSVAHSVGGEVTVALGAGENADAKVIAGTLNVGSVLTIGGGTGSDGLLVADGSAARVAIRATDEVIVGQSGTGRLAITDDASVTSPGDIRIGNLATGVGIVSMSGGTLLPVEHPTLAAQGAGRLFVGVGGSGALTIDGFAMATAAGDVLIGSSGGSEGVVVVLSPGSSHSAGLVCAGDLEIAVNRLFGAGSGRLEVVGDGQVDVSGAVRVGDADGGHGALAVSGGSLSCSSLEFEPTGHASFEFTGGEVRINGGTANVPDDSFVIAGNDASLPHWRLVGGATQEVPVNLLIGTSGSTGGEVSIETGSSLSADNVTIAYAEATTGAVTVSGLGSRLIASGAVVVADEGNGSLDVVDGGLVSNHVLLVGTNVGSDGRVTATGAGTLLDSLESIQVLEAGGAMTLGAGATARAGTAIWIDGRLDAPGGTLEAGEEMLITGEVMLDQGTINAGQTKVFAGGILGGHGIVSGGVKNSGTISPTGSGFVFTGMVESSDAEIAGTAIEFEGAGSGFTGQGVIDADVLSNDPLGSIIATGDLVMGRATSHLGFHFGGSLFVGPHTVTLLDQGAPRTPALVELRGGRLVADVSPESSDDAVRGVGVVDGLASTSRGTYAPGFTVGDPTGVLSFTKDLRIGFFEEGEFGKLAIDVGGTAEGQFDAVAVAGTFFPGFGSSRLQITLLQGANVLPGQAVRIATAAAVSGTFTEVLQSGVAGGGFRVRYNPASIELVYCPADMDGNGTLNVFDFLNFQTAFSVQDPAADFAAPFGTFNVFDFLAFQTAFSNVC